ncbi:response regulator [Sphingobium sp. GW456-12-10-14-TSB1]|uniref:response regulator n=1 Tax=Sphingobium sp. GW456-12-10-14-TSB1 TaxID=1987165 RepID=UPI0020CBE8E9|nr:response regulator [Sphingobium sp. GW456-12-10-14-TSB1]
MGLGSGSAAVLVVEDEPLVRTMAADILMDAGYRVFEACEAADALAILDGRDDIGAVFTDIEMPGGMTGLALAAAVRDRWPSMPVLVTLAACDQVQANCRTALPISPSPTCPVNWSPRSARCFLTPIPAINAPSG